VVDKPDTALSMSSTRVLTTLVVESAAFAMEFAAEIEELKPPTVVLNVLTPVLNVEFVEAIDEIDELKPPTVVLSTFVDETALET
jgi:hypothetical protein